MAESVEKYFRKLKEKERIRKQSRRHRLGSKNEIGRRTGQKIRIGPIEDIADLFQSFDSDSSNHEASGVRNAVVSARKSAKANGRPSIPSYGDSDSESDYVVVSSRSLPGKATKSYGDSILSNLRTTLKSTGRSFAENTAMEPTSKSYVDHATQCETPMPTAKKLAHTTFREMATQMSSGIDERVTARVEKTVHKMFGEMVAQMSSGMTKRTVAKKKSTAQESDITEKLQSQEIFQKIISSRKSSGKRAKEIGTNTDHDSSLLKNSPDPRSIKSPKQVVEAYTQMISSQKSHSTQSDGSRRRSFARISPSLTPQQKLLANLRRKLSFVGEDNKENPIQKPLVTLDPHHVSSAHPVFELDKASSNGSNVVVEQGDTNRRNSTVWLFASPKKNESVVKKWKKRSSVPSRSSSKSLDHSAKQPLKPISLDSSGANASKRNRGRPRSRQMLDFSDGSDNSATEDAQHLTTNRQRSNAKKKLSYSKVQSPRKGRSSGRVSFSKRSSKKSGTLVEYSSSDEEHDRQNAVVHLSPMRRSGTTVTQNLSVTSKSQRSARHSRQFLQSLAEQDIQVPDSYFENPHKYSGRIVSLKKNSGHGNDRKEWEKNPRTSRVDSEMKKKRSSKLMKDSSSHDVRIQSPGNASVKSGQGYRSRYYSTSSESESEIGRGKSAKFASNQRSKKASPQKEKREDQDESDINKRERRLNKGPELQNLSAMSTRKTSGKKRLSKRSVQNRKSNQSSNSRASQSLSAWLKSAHQFHEQESPIHLPHSKARSTYPEKTTKVDQKSQDVANASENDNSEDRDHPPLPNVDESKIYHSVDNARTRQRKSMGPPASTPRAKKIAPLTRKNLSALVVANEIIDYPVPLNDEPESVIEGAEVIHSSSYDSHDDYSKDSYTIGRMGNEHKADISKKKRLLQDLEQSGRSLRSGKKRVSNTAVTASVPPKVARNTSASSRKGPTGSKDGSSATQTRKRKTKDRKEGTNMESSKRVVSSVDEEAMTASKMRPKNSQKAAAKNKGVDEETMTASKIRSKKSQKATAKIEGVDEETMTASKIRSKKSQKAAAKIEGLLMRHEQQLTIVVPKGSSGSKGVRRSRRVRMRPLGYGEKLIYDPNKFVNGFRKIIGVQRNREVIPIDVDKTKGDVIQLPAQENGILGLKKKPHTKKRGRLKKVEKTQVHKNMPKKKSQDTSRHHEDISEDSGSSSQEFHSNTGNVSENITFLVMDTATDSKISVGVNSLICNEQGAFGQPLNAIFSKDGITVSKGLSLKINGKEGTGTAHGMVKIQPLCKKVERVVNNANISFFVHKGVVELTLAGTAVTLPQKTYFQVPCKNRYSLWNPSEVRPAELFFTLFKISKPTLPAIE